MANQTRFHRRQIFRNPPARFAWRVVRRSHVKRVLRALEALYGRRVSAT